MTILRELAKRCGFRVLGSSLAVTLRLRALREARPVTILNFHRVGLSDGSAYRAMDPQLFERLIVWLDRHFTITLFSRLHQPAPKPKLILSFDDGYADFVEVTMPILARHGIAVNQNVIPDCAETGLPPLNILAADFIGKAPPELVRRLRIPGFEAGDGRSLWHRLDEFIKYRPQAEQKRLAAILLRQFRAWDGYRPTPMMSVSDVAAATSAGHEIGAHSYSHSSMAQETDAYLVDDVARCRAWFADRLGAELEIYAFPNGSLRPGQADLVAQCGIKHILLLDEDFTSGRSPHRRFSVSAQGAAEARFKALGRFRPPSGKERPRDHVRVAT